MEKLKIYKVEQDWNNDYDTYDSFICIAESEQRARETHPSDSVTHHKEGNWYGTYSKGGEYIQDSHDWVEFTDINKLKVTFIGYADEYQKTGIVCASFNAG